MKKNHIIFLLLFSIILSDENKWASTRFEHWWNKNFNSMTYRESFSFMPYQIKIGTFYYGGDGFGSQFFSDGHGDFNTSPFILAEGTEFSFINDIKFRKGIDLEINFLGYNLFQKLQNTVDIIMMLGYKLSKPLTMMQIDLDWPNSDDLYYYYPVLHNYKISTIFAMQPSEKFSPYFSYSYGLIDGKLFIDSNDEGIISAKGQSESVNLGFNIVGNLKKKNY